ncbi:hypothetical protein M011DRAFT_241519 [Sporormia fimetaria CBS 119925]|uniref:Uncharacterized protein n=1 Tax=Sporormia fimetaria CBS 119925 TaxID=1340428 RepID=A0A6A6VKR5_9PLEO|nr:hypothetical protein M011DRAFT_241519 [Sporormia fimetaria CBS 119925]
MCYHNLTQHNGCGHIGERHTAAWTLCAAAEQRLAQLRGPTPIAPSTTRPPKLGKRFTSFGSSFSRSNTANPSLQRTMSGPPSSLSVGSRTSISSATTQETSCGDIPRYEFNSVKCGEEVCETRTQVTRDMDVCKGCKRWIEEMRSMIAGYDRSGIIRGTKVYEEFLKARVGDDAGPVRG